MTARRIRTGLIGTGVLILFSAVYGHWDSARALAQESGKPFYALVDRAEGRPVARGDKGEVALTRGVRIEENQSVITGPGEMVALKLSTGDDVIVMENSQITVTRQSGKSPKLDVVNLFQGKGFTWSRIEPSKSTQRFTVTTPSAAAGIRGTSFSARVDPATGDEGFCVCEGVIEVKAGGDTGQVRAGEYMGVSNGSKPEKPFGDLGLLKYPSPKTKQCLSCHQGGNSRDAFYAQGR